jgi:hypothetical protein
LDHANLAGEIMPSATKKVSSVLALILAMTTQVYAQGAGASPGTAAGSLDSGPGTGGDRGMENATRAVEGRTEAPAGIGASAGSVGVGAGAASGTVGGGVDSGSSR